jgi:hypothetical protein
MRRVPLSLAVVLVLAALHSLAWSVLLPPFQGQDEISHVAYTQRWVERGEVPWTAVTNVPDGQPYSTELGRANEYSGSAPTALNVAGRPFTSEVDERRWEREVAKYGDAQREDGQMTSALRNPPLYYLTQSAVYWPLSEAGIFDRVYAMRWATIPWFLAAVLFAWLLAGEIFGRRRWLQTITALAVALQPMLAQLGGIVNPDAMIAAVWGLGLWLSAVIVNRGITRGRVIASALVSVGAFFIHPRAAPVAVALAGALAIRLWPRVRERGRSARTAALAAGAAVTAAVLAAGTWYAVHGEMTATKVREFGSYLWQFYLPRPSFMQETAAAHWDVRDVFVDRLWSGFVQLEINFPRWILDTLWWVTLAAAVVTLVVLVVRRRALNLNVPLLVLFGVTFVVSMWALHVAAWRDLPFTGDPILTGRYLTPLLPLMGLAIASIAVVLPRRIGPAAALVVLGIEGLLAISAMGTALVRFYV